MCLVCLVYSMCVLSVCMGVIVFVFVALERGGDGRAYEGVDLWDKCGM